MRNLTIRGAVLTAVVSLGLFTVAEWARPFAGIAWAAESGTAAGSGFGKGSSGLGGGSSSELSTSGSSSEPAVNSSSPDKTVDRTTPANGGKAPAGGLAGDTGESSAPVDGVEEGTTTSADKDPATTTKSAATLAAAATAVVPDAAAVNAPEKASVPQISSNGSLTHLIELGTPEYRDIAPKLALHYDSARKSRLGGLYQGWLGYGWGLDGLDVIERESAGGGVPALSNSVDVYVLNGEALVACSAASSCQPGSTHTTEHESSQRIILDSTTNRWTVTDSKGVVTTFQSVAEIAGTPAAYPNRILRYLPTSVVDPNGNRVTFLYTCPDLPVCHPKRIDYDSHSYVAFGYE
ncbi:hypothetical protein [Rhizobium sp. TAL182]|nr:hypothetical protein [Rhizobium sp. TAL182]